MTPERRSILDKDMSATLTEEELAEGWHFCLDWDQLLIHKSHREFECCSCPWGDKDRDREDTP